MVESCMRTPSGTRRSRARRHPAPDRWWRACDHGPHGVPVVLDDVDHGKLPQLRHVEALVHLALVGGAVAQVCKADIVGLAVARREGEPGAERNLRADDAMAAEEALL